MNLTTINRAADNIRVLAASMVEKAKSGHPGGAMGGADFVNVLYSQFLVTDPDDGKWLARDRFFLDPGHMSPMLYSVLALFGHYTVDELQQFRQWGSPTPGHPELHPERGVENTSGPLGQGHTMAVGCAIAEQFLAARFGNWLSHKTYAFISDGGVQEEISQGAGRIAGHLGLHNLIMFYDSNKVQLSTMVEAVDAEDVAAKYRAWNWNVLECNGNDPEDIAKAIVAAQGETEKPTIIIGHTVMGKGCVKADGSNYEGQCSTHGQPISAAGADYAKTMENLGADPANPWVIFDDVKKLYDDRRAELRKIVAAKRAEQAAWEAANPALAAELHDFLNNKLPQIDWAAIPHKANIASRQASADVLAVLAEKVKNMIVSSADLANSDKTDAFLKKTHPFVKGDFSGAFLHAGVTELTMAAIMNGIVLHGGVIGACGTFFVFSDYMKPAVRMAALMELPVKYIWTHDAFRVGEDGPTHEPVEQEAQLRLMEELRNLSGKPSMLVLRPADATETTVAWEMAMENFETPSALVLSRQNLPDLPAASGDRFAEAQAGCRKGGYIVVDAQAPDVILVANGSEVSLLVDVAKEIAEKGIKARVVSVPSIGLFNNQSVDYRQAVLTPGVPAFGLTAGLPSTLRGVVGSDGVVFGLDHFGASAPYKVLDEKFGFTTAAVAEKVLAFLGK